MIDRLYISARGGVTRSIHTPKGTCVVERDAETVTIKVPGHTYWVGLYRPRAYAPVEYVTYRIVELTPAADASSDTVRGEVVARYSATEWRAHVRQRVRS